MKNKGRVAMLLSGGVDSSVAAALLKEQGYEVIGFYILGWTGTAEFPCSWQKEEADARAVAQKLGIDFQTVNLTKVYESAVIDQFFADYQAGLTPNPDILCNREIKFKALWQAIRQFECDFIATGHYARIKNGQIFKAQDTNKDQSYFLWGIDRSILPKIIFPLGQLTKPEVRELAKKYHLPTATKKDSQGICFVGPLKVREFLKSQLQLKPGPVVLKDGRVIATHQGVPLYTIGQRLGESVINWRGDRPPLFVIAKDVKRNLIVVGSDVDTFTSEITVSQLNWFGGDLPEKFEALVKIRYRQNDVPAQIKHSGGLLRLKFLQPVRAATVGQSVVFYDSSGQLLGGGVIVDVPSQTALVRLLAQQVTRSTAS